MKRNLMMSIAGAFFMVLAGAAIVSAGLIKNSAHDFGASGYTWTTDFQICEPCHTPHNSGIAELLWNHDPTGTATFVMYSSWALDATLTQPDATSLKCLSCHDGSVEVDAFGGSAGTSFIGDIAYSAYIGKGTAGAATDDLSNDHPVGFDFTLINAMDSEIYSLGSVPAGNINDILTANNVVGCYTCHDVHNTDTPAGVSKLLRQTNASSALCLTCHDK